MRHHAFRLLPFWQRGGAMIRRGAAQNFASLLAREPPDAYNSTSDVELTPLISLFRLR
jgi:hypothetical protein